jgi:hypothetical protein
VEAQFQNTDSSNLGSAASSRSALLAIDIFTHKPFVSLFLELFYFVPLRTQRKEGGFIVSYLSVAISGTSFTSLNFF